MIHVLAVPVKSLRNAAEETEAGDKHVCVCIFDKVGERDGQRIIHKAIVVVNTHGHPDHIFGNVYFDEAYMNPKDNELAESFINAPEFIKECKKAAGLSSNMDDYFDRKDAVLVAMK
nr:MBL fold metallo-hydrolase [uncultured Butyrivibrio sp.]